MTTGVTHMARTKTGIKTNDETVIYVRLPEDTLKRVRCLAAPEGIDKDNNTAVIRWALTQFVKNHGGDEPD